MLQSSIVKLFAARYCAGKKKKVYKWIRHIYFVNAYWRLLNALAWMLLENTSGSKKKKNIKKGVCRGNLKLLVAVKQKVMSVHISSVPYTLSLSNLYYCCQTGYWVTFGLFQCSSYYISNDTSLHSFIPQDPTSFLKSVDKAVGTKWLGA